MDKGTATTCIFCKIINKDIDSEFIFENDDFIVIKDLVPKAPIHLLIIPKTHIPTLNDLDNDSIGSSLFNIAKELATRFNVAKDGYRLILNCIKKGGQSVFHMHLHFLAGKQMSVF